MAAKGGSRRDLRLDVARGLALFFIFIDHIPGNKFSAVTMQALGFFDAAEAFIFLSGYTAALVYGRSLQRDGVLIMSARVYRRVWTLYVAHLFLFLVLSAIVSYVIESFGSPVYAEESRIGDFLSEPHIALVRALTLEFQPTFLDILPLYIVLLAVFPLILVLLDRSPWAALIPSLMLYGVVHAFDIRFHGYPEGNPSFFNPLAWQLLFVIGAAAGLSRVKGRSLVDDAKWLIGPAIAIAAIAFLIDLSWTAHRFVERIPAVLGSQIWPINKTDLSPYRLVNFLAVAFVAAWLIRPDTPWLASPWMRPVALAGKYSLHVFCFGIILSLVGHFVLVEISGSFLMQAAVTVVGVAAMIGLASLLAWYARVVEAKEAGAG
ncbi:MAG: OpgC domain-containing protein [Alphaproteobacteria bacterium]|nr:OpgC domain-containing protein [Alphaproteobacteria bacterium]